jgi:FtsZ-binding cell division protein ZapB
MGTLIGGLFAKSSKALVNGIPRWRGPLSGEAKGAGADDAECAAQTRVAALQQENERLRRDNERFVRIIDSGEWGRGRVAELVQAGQVLKQERDQLRTLMGALRDDYEAVERAKTAQQEELAALKDRMKRKGAANNKMLIKARAAPRL